MTTAADDSADETAFEAFLAGRPVSAQADGSSPAVVSFAGAVRATAILPGRPNAALAELLTTGLLTDQSSPSARTAPSTGRSPRRSRVRRRRFAMFFPALIAKFLSLGAVAQAASGVGIAVVAFTGAGATGLLGNDVQTTLTSVVGVAEKTGDVSTPTDAPTAEPADTETVETSTETPAVEAPAPAAAAFDPKAWALEGPADGETFGQWVRQAARAGQADSAVITMWAHRKHVDPSEFEGIEGIDDPASPSATPTAEVETETEHASEATHGNGNGGGTSGHGGGHGGRGHN